MEPYVNNGKYVIPLGTTDLSLLSLLNISPKYYNDIMPIWSKSNLQQRSEDCYYEFEVKDEEDISDTNESSTDNLSYTEVDTEMSTNLCHICNLKVPLPYMREHVDSPKHKTYLMITEIALERVKNQMRLNYATENPDPTKYFCQTCVAVVPIRDKSLHFKSIVHKNASLSDKLLKDLLKLYTDQNSETDEHDDEYEIESLKYDASDKIINETLKVNGTKKCSDLDQDVEECVKLVKLVNKDADKEIDYNQKSVNAFESVNKNAIVNNVTNLTEYLNTLNSSTVFTHTLEDINGEYLIIKTKNGNHLKVGYDNFHGIVTIGKHHLHCKLCNEIINTKMEHIYAPGHIEKVTLPIRDKHCIRELDEMKSYCILCNDVIENADIHTLCSEVHNTWLKKSIMLSVEDMKNEKHKKPNNIIIETHNEKQSDFSLQKYGVGKTDGDKVNIMQANLEELKIMFEEENKSQIGVVLDKHYTVEADIVNSKNTLFEEGNVNHCKHVEQKIVVEDNNPIPKDNFCNVCYISIHANDQYSHKSGARHKINEKLDFHYLLEHDNASNKLSCKICKCLVHTKFIDAHLNNPDHDDNYNTLLTANNMIKTIRNVYCELCGVYMRIGNELIHINAAKHNKLLLESKDVTVSKSTKDVRVKKVKGKDKNKHFCDVCKVYVPNNAYNIETHYSGNSHKNNFSKYLSIKNMNIKGTKKKQTLTKVSKSSETKIPANNKFENTRVTDHISTALQDDFWWGHSSN